MILMMLLDHFLKLDINCIEKKNHIYYLKHFLLCSTVHRQQGLERDNVSQAVSKFYNTLLQGLIQ